MNTCPSTRRKTAAPEARRKYHDALARVSPPAGARVSAGYMALAGQDTLAQPLDGVQRLDLGGAHLEAVVGVAAAKQSVVGAHRGQPLAAGGVAHVGDQV